MPVVNVQYLVLAYGACLTYTLLLGVANNAIGGHVAVF